MLFLKKYFTRLYLFDILFDILLDKLSEVFLYIGTQEVHTMKFMNFGADNPKTYNKDNKVKKNPGYDIMTVMSTTTALLILSVAASIMFVLVINLTKANNNNNVNNNVLQGIETASANIEVDDTQPDTYVEEEPVQNTEIQEQALGTLTIVSDVNIRDNPDTDNSNVIKVAKASETYEYLGLADYGNWYIILLEDGTKGYVYKGYVSAN